MLLVRSLLDTLLDINTERVKVLKKTVDSDFTPAIMDSIILAYA